METYPRCTPCQGEVDIDAFLVTRDWGSTGTNEITAKEVTGFLANKGDVTWEYAVYPSVPWSKAGGDIGADVIASELDVSNRVVHKFHSEDNFVEAVQGMVEGTVENYGFLLKTAEDVSGGDGDTAYRVFHGTEHENEVDRPKLFVHYAPA